MDPKYKNAILSIMVRTHIRPNCYVSLFGDNIRWLIKQIPVRGFKKENHEQSTFLDVCSLYYVTKPHDWTILEFIIVSTGPYKGGPYNRPQLLLTCVSRHIQLGLDIWMTYEQAHYSSIVGGYMDHNLMVSVCQRFFFVIFFFRRNRF